MSRGCSPGCPALSPPQAKLVASAGSKPLLSESGNGLITASEAAEASLGSLDEALATQAIENSCRARFHASQAHLALASLLGGSSRGEAEHLRAKGRVRDLLVATECRSYARLLAYEVAGGRSISSLSSSRR